MLAGEVAAAAATAGEREEAEAAGTTAAGGMVAATVRFLAAGHRRAQGRGPGQRGEGFEAYKQQRCSGALLELLCRFWFPTIP